MAPLGRLNDGEVRHASVKWIRDGATTGTSGGASVQAQDASAGSSPSASIYLGVGVGVGGAILIAVVVMIVQIVRKRAQHRRMIEALEVEQAIQVAQQQDITEVPRPASVARCNTLMPLHTRAGWGALSSNETVNEPETATQTNKRKRDSVSLPKRLRQRGIPLKRLKRLTAILESPRSKAANSPAPALQQSMQTDAGAEDEPETGSSAKRYTLQDVDEEDVFVCPGSPKPEVLPSFAIRSPGRYGAGIANNDNPKAGRSRSVGALSMPIPSNAMLGHTARLSRSKPHLRSISLGAPPSRPPSGPVPPIPVIAPYIAETLGSSRQGMCVARASTSSHGSTGSSVLVASPLLQMHERDKPLDSPKFEQLVAEEDSASLKIVSKKQCHVQSESEAAGPSANEKSDGLKSHTSIRSNIARYSAESQTSHRLSSSSSVSSFSQRNRLSVPRIGTADQISISRVSSNNSLTSGSAIKKIVTPRKSRISSVSASGSPAERKRSNILRDISGNSMLPSRQPSDATQDSGRSSNGNPFQWDQQPLCKPSALKGSPNARKGHRRQNCVRISTLTPQILGPPPSRPTSPSIMHGIEEESADSDEQDNPVALRFVSNQRPARPPSTGSFAPNRRFSALRASLTPSSPTLSAWTAYQEHGLPSQVSDNSLTASIDARPMSRQSNRSSAFSLPSFPSPGRGKPATAQLSQPIPEFCLSRPSTDTVEDNRSLPTEHHLQSDVEMPSSPPLPVSKHEQYDPAWPSITIPAPQTKAYDPASPAWDVTEPVRSSAFFPFAINGACHPVEEEISPHSRPSSYGGKLPDTPPCSPKTMPEGFQAFFDKQDSETKPPRASEKLTSENASSIMARMPSKVDFPGAPILPPPEEPEDYCQTTPRSATRQRSISHVMRFQPLRPAPPPPVPSDDVCMPSPLNISGKQSPQGPRTQPAHSVLKNAMALRRMNSEVNNTSHRESRRYVRLGREASPLLPWIGSPDPSESCGDMNELFDFDFAASTEPGAERHTSALDEIDMTEVERTIDGALAGFDAIPSDDTVQARKSSSVWEDGERYWEQQQSPGNLLPIDVTPKKDQGHTGVVMARPLSIQATPKSLYDSDGFLRM